MFVFVPPLCMCSILSSSKSAQILRSCLKKEFDSTWIGCSACGDGFVRVIKPYQIKAFGSKRGEDGRGREGSCI